MNKNPMRQMVEEFHQKFGFSIARPFTPDDVLEKRLRFIEEEFKEFMDAVASGQKPETLKELCDLLYQVMGFVVAYDLPLEEGFARVHHSNMSKSPAFADGKAIKGPGYVPADLRDLFGPNDQAA
jgi:predicted HAD superfamily Cof-like phosphohydrolase